MMIPCIPGHPHHLGHCNLLDSLGPQSDLPMVSAALGSAYWVSVLTCFENYHTSQLESFTCCKQSKPVRPMYKAVD